MSEEKQNLPEQATGVLMHLMQRWRWRSTLARKLVDATAAGDSSDYAVCVGRNRIVLTKKRSKPFFTACPRTEAPMLSASVCEIWWAPAHDMLCRDHARVGAWAISSRGAAWENCGHASFFPRLIHEHSQALNRRSLQNAAPDATLV